jgi:hypothetical protein
VNDDGEQFHNSAFSSRVAVHKQSCSCLELTQEIAVSNFHCFQWREC